MFASVMAYCLGVGSSHGSWWSWVLLQHILSSYKITTQTFNFLILFLIELELTVVQDIRLYL
jgi:hypothetical protein